MAAANALWDQYGAEVRQQQHQEQKSFLSDFATKAAAATVAAIGWEAGLFVAGVLELSAATSMVFAGTVSASTLVTAEEASRSVAGAEPLTQKEMATQLLSGMALPLVFHGASRLHEQIGSISVPAEPPPVRVPAKPLGPTLGVKEPTLGEIFTGYDPETMLHITPEPAQSFETRGVDEGTFWVRLGDVAHLTPHQYRVGVVAPSAAGFGPDATTFAIAPPGSSGSFKSSPPQGYGGYPEYISTQQIRPSAFVSVPAGPNLPFAQYMDPRCVPEYGKK